jgi:hypothetical protein
MMNLILRGEMCYRLENPADLVRRFIEDPAEANSGLLYYTHASQTNPDELCPEDAAIPLLLNAAWHLGPAKTIVRSLMQLQATVCIGMLPNVPFQDTTAEIRDKLASLIHLVSSYPGIKAAVATKILHKKRPNLIPVLDNQSIFGAYMF